MSKEEHIQIDSKGVMMNDEVEPVKIFSSTIVLIQKKKYQEHTQNIQGKVLVNPRKELLRKLWKINLVSLTRPTKYKVEDINKINKRLNLNKGTNLQLKVGVVSDKNLKEYYYTFRKK